MTTLESLDNDLVQVKKKLQEGFNLLQGKLPEDKKKVIEAKYTKLEVRRDRLAIAKDILEGRAFLIHEHENELYIIKPGDKTAKLVNAAEQYGAKVTKYEADRTHLILE